MVCLGFEPGAAGWNGRTNPLSYDGTPVFTVLFIQYLKPLMNVHTPLTNLSKANYPLVTIS